MCVAFHSADNDDGFTDVGLRVDGECSSGTNISR
jgi:hypothetical protein